MPSVKWGSTMMVCILVPMTSLKVCLESHRLTSLTEKLIYTEAGSMVPEDHRHHVKYGLANI